MDHQNAKPRGNSRVMRSGGAELVIDPQYATFERIANGNYMITEGNSHYRYSVARIEFHDALPRIVQDAWDASEAGDGSVVAWLDAGVLHFAAQGGVIAPEDSSWLFSHYVACAEIRFNGCFDTSRVTNMSFMFYACTSLQTLDLSGFDTSRVTQMVSMFEHCRSLTALDVSRFDTSRVADMGSLFSSCVRLQSLNLSGIDTSRVENMKWMFSGCESLLSLDVSGLDTARVTNMFNMFMGCSQIKALNLSNFNTSHVENMRGMFAGCSSLTALDLSGLDTSQVTDMSRMFSGCESLTALNLSGLDTSQVTDMHEMFKNCRSLTALELSGFDTTRVTGISEMFAGCESLTALDLSGFRLAGDAHLRDMLAGCEALRSENIRGFSALPKKARESLPQKIARATRPARFPHPGVVRTPGRAALGAGSRVLISVGLMGSHTDELFRARESVKRIEFHDSISGAGWNAWDASEAHDGSVLAWLTGDVLHFAAEGGVIAPPSSHHLFAYYTNCEEIRFNGCFDTGRTRSMDGMFLGCASLTSLDLSGFRTAGVIEMDDMFNGCRSLTSLDVSNFNTVRATAVEGWHYMDAPRDTDLERMFLGCDALLPQNIRGSDQLPPGALANLPRQSAAERERLRRKSKAAKRMRMERAMGIQVTTPRGDSRVMRSWVEFGDGSGFLVQGAGESDHKWRREDVERIEFHNSLRSAAANAWDASDQRDHSVLAWMDRGTLHFAAKGGVIAPADCCFLFVHYKSCREIRFNGCFDTSQVTKMGGSFYGMFKGCQSLTALDLSGFDTSQVKTMHRMFYGCESLTALDLSSFDTSQVTDMGGMFSGCSSLTRLNLSSFDTRRAWNMNSMFEGCSSLTELDLSNFDTASAEWMEDMFHGCRALASLDISGFDTARTTTVNGPHIKAPPRETDLESMFAGCDALSPKNIRGYELLPPGARANLPRQSAAERERLRRESEAAKRERMARAQGIQAAPKPAAQIAPKPAAQATPKPAAPNRAQSAASGTFTPQKGANSEPRVDSRVMMPGCMADGPYYKYGTLPGEEPGTYWRGYLVTGIDSIRSRGSDHRWHREDVKRIEFHDSLRFAGADAWDASERRDRSVLAWMDDGVLHFAAEGGVIAPTDSHWLFACYISCEEIRFNGCFDTSRVTNMASMFERCKSLTALDLSRFDTSQVKYMCGMFADCESLTALDLSGFDTSQVEYMEEMFKACCSLTKLNLSSFETRSTWNMDSMFRDCISLTALDLSSFDTSSVERMEDMFHGCWSLAALDISGFDTARATAVNGPHIIQPPRETDLERMFLDCDALSPENIQGYDRLPPGACASLPMQDAAERERLRRESEAAKRERMARAQGIQAAPKPAAPQQAQDADDWETRTGGEVPADIWKQHHPSAQKSKPQKEFNPLWLLALVLLVLFGILAICVPDSGHSIGGTEHHSPTPIPTTRTAQEIEMQELVKRLKELQGADSAASAPLGGD